MSEKLSPPPCQKVGVRDTVREWVRIKARIGNSSGRWLSVSFGPAAVVKRGSNSGSRNTAYIELTV